MVRIFERLATVVALVVGLELAALGGDDFWKNPLDGTWSSGTNWLDGSTPGNADTANFNLAGSFTVSFNVAPQPIQNLSVTSGNVTFDSRNSTQTLSVLAPGGTQNLDLSGAGTSLSIGTSGNPLNLTVGGALSIQSGATLAVGFGSHVAGPSLSTSGLNGGVMVDGSGSILTLTSPSQLNVIGGGGAPGFLNLSSGASASIFGEVDVAGAATPGIGSFTITGGSTATTTNQLTLANQNVAGSNASMIIDGASSALTQTGARSVVVGSQNNGVATLDIGTVAGGGSLTTGTNGLVVNSTGTINVGSTVGATSGSLLANGDIMINGGGLNLAAGSTFSIPSGATMTVQSAGHATFGGTTLPSISDFTMSIKSGGQLTAAKIDIGTTLDGTLTVDGSGSLATSSSVSKWGLAGNSANITFSSNSAGNFSNGLLLACDEKSSSVNATVQSGSQLSVGNLTLAASPVQPVSGLSSAVLTVMDANSAVVLSAGSNLILGDVFGDLATINVQNGATFTVGNGGSTTLNAGSFININGGIVDLKTIINGGGSINFAAGSLSFIGNLTVGPGGFLGTDIALGVNRQLSLTGTTTVSPFHVLTLNGGTLSTGNLVVNGTFNFSAGTLNLTGASGATIGNGGPFGANFTLGSGQNLNVTNTTTINSGSLLVLENGSGFSTGNLANNGEMDLDGISATATGTTINNSGLIRGEGRIVATAATNAMTNATSGEIRAESGKRIQVLGTNGANAGRINLQGGTAEFTQALTNGATGQIVGRGTLKVGGTGLTNLGSISLASGTTDVFGPINNNTGSATKGISISSNATANFWDDVANTSGFFKVNSGSTATFFGAFSGNGISGNATDIHFEGDVNPGFSPASVAFGGNVSMGAAANLNIEVGGTQGSQFDSVHVAGQLALDGTLRVSLINGFSPAVGDHFSILSWAGLGGTFSSLSLPALANSEIWSTSQLYSAGILSIVAGNIKGDFNRDGQLTAADLPVMLQALTELLTYETNYNVTDPTLLTIGDMDSSGAFNNADLQGMLHLLQTAGPAPLPGGTVPEPPAAMMLLMGGLATTGYGIHREFRRRKPQSCKVLIDGVHRIH